MMKLDTMNESQMIEKTTDLPNQEMQMTEWSGKDYKSMFKKTKR